MENWATEACSWTLEKKRNRWKSLAGAVLGIALLCTNAAGALADPTPLHNKEELTQKLEESKVGGIQPPGVTLNLFDYVASKDGKTEKDLLGVYGGAKESDWNKGINQHGMLLFGDGMIGAGYWNIGAGANRLWARNNTNMQGIVKPILKDGYPCVDTQRAGMTLEQTSDNTSELGLPNVEHANDENSANDAKDAKGLSGALTGREPSLKYLFDPAVNLGADVKRSYSGVTGLFRVDDEGYYYYDARQNFAEYDEDSNAFILYNAPAVWRSDGAWDGSGFNGKKSIGNFYPFNKGEQVFDSVDGSKRLTSSDGMDNAKWSSATNGFENKATGNHFFINHHMGMSMTVDFAQPENGTIKMGKAGEKDMVFQFSGDDDVWVFVDDVLVLDLGGIHSELYGTINFATGEVRTGQGWRYASGMPEEGKKEPENSYRERKLYDLFKEALREDDPKVTNGWTTSSAGNKIFATGTSHTLKLFYLERGNYDSSLHMKFNLQPPLSHSIRKVDQDGEPLEGAKFNLYAAKLKDGSTENSKEGCANAADYETVDAPIGTFTTDKDGMATLAKNGSPLSFSDRYHQSGNLLYILREVDPPEGYRKLPNDIVLRFNPDTSMLVVLNRYQTGAYASFYSSVKELGTLTYGAFDKVTGNIEADENSPLADDNEQKGLVIAVPMLLQKNLSGGGEGQSDGTWVALYGSNSTSYQAVIPEERSAQAWRKAVLTAALYQASDTAWPEWYLDYNEEGYLEGELKDLPGRADRYALINEDSADMKMVYGIIEPDALKVLGIKGNSTAARYDALEDYVAKALKDGAATGKTPDQVMEEICKTIGFDTGDFGARGFSFLNTDQFQRDFRSMIYIPNERRELRLWKVDEDGKGVNGARFALYQEDGTQVASGVTATVDGRDGVLTFMPEPPAGKDGYAAVTWDNEGRYYIQETTAPAGYKLNPTKIPVVVGHYSVYAGAGDKTDGVSVMAGVGKLMQTMSRYAADNAVNITLRDITAIAQKQDSLENFTLDGWEDVPLEGANSIARSMNLHYGRNAVIDYGLHDEDGGRNIYPFFTTDEGFLRTRVEQNTAALQKNDMYPDAVNGANFDDLSGIDISNLFCQINIVVVTDPKETKPATGTLRISKAVAGSGLIDADYTRNFTFTVTLRDKDGTPLPGEYYYYGEQRAGYIRDGGMLSLRHDEALTVLGLPEGARWTITETSAGADWKVLPASGTISGGIGKNETAYASFINHKGLPLGDLTVTKKVAGSGGDTQKDFHFTVTLNDKTLSGEFGDMTFTDGVAEFVLRHGESKTAAGLPVGIRYTVEETKTENYEVSSTNASGVVEEAGAKAEFVNTYKKPESDVPKTDVIITKIWNDEGYDGRPDSFTVIVRANDDPTFWHKRVIKRDEPSTEVSKDGNTWTFYAKWNVHDYRIEEVDVPGYVSSVVKDGNRFTITNTYMPKTGDSRPVLRDILLAGCGLVLLAAAWRLFHVKKPQKRR